MALIYRKCSIVCLTFFGNHVLVGILDAGSRGIHNVRAPEKVLEYLKCQKDIGFLMPLSRIRGR